MGVDGGGGGGVCYEGGCGCGGGGGGGVPKIIKYVHVITLSCMKVSLQGPAVTLKSDLCPLICY